MLTSESYQIAWLVYVSCGVASIVYLFLWWRKLLSPGTRLTLILLLAAILLTPAHPSPDTPGYAPALVVAGFDLLTNGPQAAVRPLRPMMLMLAVAMGISLLAQLLGWLLRRSQKA